jgi:hypothetical protein
MLVPWVRFARYSVLLVVFALPLAPSWVAHADDSEKAAPKPAAVQHKRSKVRDDDIDLEHNTPDPAPPVPNVLEHAPRAGKMTVVEQAGVGGPLAYATATVLEVGGAGSMSVSGDRLYLRMAPFVAWFVLDGFRLSYTHELYTSKLHKHYRISTAMLLGADVHFRLNDRLLIAVGPDVGGLYNGDRWGVMVRPKVMLDILVGRSAILHPGLFFAWSSVDVIDASGADTPDKHIAFGFDIAYAAMF